jgi:CheY-like chemotaxis protein
MKRDSLKNKSYSPKGIARICDVHFTTVYYWIGKGLLSSRKTPGGHNHINETDLVAFLKKYEYPVPKSLAKTTPDKILIVEDDHAQRRLLTRLIKDNFSGCEVFEAENGFEAGFMVRELRPALVVLDLLLPGIHGAKICRMIRQCKELNATKILALTGYKVQKAKRILLKAGADIFLAKPFQNQEFIEAADTLLGIEIQPATTSPKSHKI